MVCNAVAVSLQGRWVSFVAPSKEDASSWSLSQEAHLDRAGSYQAVLILSPGVILAPGSSGLCCFPVKNSGRPSKIYCGWFPFSETQLEEILYGAIVRQTHILLAHFS